MQISWQGSRVVLGQEMQRHEPKLYCVWVVQCVWNVHNGIINSGIRSHSQTPYSLQKMSYDFHRCKIV